MATASSAGKEVGRVWGVGRRRVDYGFLMWVQRARGLAHSSWTGANASGRPTAAVRKMQATSPILEEIRYRMNALVLLKMARPSST